MASVDGLNEVQICYERVITKLFKKYDIPLKITDDIRAAVRAKLWRMGKLFSKLGGKNRQEQLDKWKDGHDATWNFTVSGIEVNRQLLSKKRKLEEQLNEENAKRRKLEKEVSILTKTTKQQAKTISRIKTGRSETSRGSSSKLWTEYSRQQQHNKRKTLAKGIQGALSFCEDERFRPCTLLVENIDTGNREILDINCGKYSKQDETVAKDVHSALYVKDKYCVSNTAFHELSMLSNLPNSSEVKKLTQALNSKFEIRNTPNGVVGVQQSLRKHVTACLTHLVEKRLADGIEIPDTFRIKLTGDGTQIARGLSVVNIAFTILEEGQLACSSSGNHTIAILKVNEDYDELAAGLEDVIKEAEDLEVLAINERVFNIQLFLGGDMKFLAIVCGLECATSEHSCIWCKCPKGQRWNMDKIWSLTDPAKGARTVQEITEKSKLAKSSKNRYNCRRAPLFPFIPIKRVVIDSLHLFLRVGDVLINLFIRDLRILDGIESSTTSSKKSTTSSNNSTTSTKNTDVYVEYLNTECKIRFRWYINKESKKTTWRDLTGPEKVRLFTNIDIPTLFPELAKRNELKVLWDDFYELIKIIGKPECDIEDFELRSKDWIKLFTSIYQTKDVTPYMHALAMHVPEFMKLYGSILLFTQQGLEKLNDITTVHFQHSSNHREAEALKQLLEKRNRIEELEREGHQRTKKTQHCGICRQAGHNRRSCPSL